MNSPSEPGKNYSDAELIDLATRFVSAILGSVPRGVIDPRKWWGRAESALNVASSGAESWPHMVSEAAKRLQVPVLTDRSCKTIYSLGLEMDVRTFERFRYLCERDTIYIIAMTRIMRDEEKEERTRIEDNTKALLIEAAESETT